jgi:undecaprenyl-diphosphatase
VSITYPEALVIGALQGVTELFPVSSLGHSVLLPAVIGGRWARDLNVSAPESPYLAFIVGLHVATAFALLTFFWRDWVRIVGGFLSAARKRRVETADERLAWLIVLATIPIGLTGLALEHTFRTTLGRPVPAAIFLIVNGVTLLTGEWLRRRSPKTITPATKAIFEAGVDTSSTRLGTPAAGVGGVKTATVAGETELASDRRLSRLGFGEGTLIGSAQILALLPGISRSGIAMVAGLARGLSHEDAARFSFLLATPVILAAGVLKIPDLFGPLGNGIHGQVLAGSLVSFIGAYLSLRFLTRYFETRTLTPFAIYCLVAGIAGLIIVT